MVLKYISMIVSFKMVPITLNTIIKSFQKIFNVVYFWHHLILYLFYQPKVIQNAQLLSGFEGEH